MSAERDVNRIVRSWLGEDERESADAILGIVLSRLDATPQRRSSWPAWRHSPMNRIFLTAGAAAAILVVAILGYGLLSNRNEIGPQPSPSLSPSAAPSPTPASVPPNPLVGTWMTGATTCAQQLATLEAAGFTPEQLTSVEIDMTCANGLLGPGSTPGGRFRVRFDERGGLEVRLDGEVGAVAVYELGDGSTFELRDAGNAATCFTTRYTIDGNQLRLEIIDPACPGTSAAPLTDLVAMTSIFETAPYARVAQP